MRVTKTIIEKRVRQVAAAFPLPAGYVYQLAAKRPGTEKLYILSVCRADMKNGSLWDCPNFFSSPAKEFYAVLGGMLAANRLTNVISMLKTLEVA